MSYDVIIIGAGMSGLYQLHLLRQLGLSVRVLEEGGDLGGTWYWNRYPGARFDSESYTYGYSFSKEVLDEWEWSEHFAAQPETLRYLNFVADKFDLRKDIGFDSRIISAHFNETNGLWELKNENGLEYRSRYLITAIGPLTQYTLPRIPGIESFRGEAYHTARWPQHEVKFAGKRVAVIGTGATGIQVIQTIAEWVDHLTVFQRSATYVAPLFNSPITSEQQVDIKRRYPEIFAQCQMNPGGFMHPPIDKGALEVSDEEREATWNQLYHEPGFAILQGNFNDITLNSEANALISDFMIRKMRARVKDPKTAEKLMPKNHGFGTKRLPLETDYLETYNRNNVTLVDLKRTPIEEITPTGIRTTDQGYEFDMIIYATGFDAITGGFDRIDIRGRDGKRLKEKWSDGPRTYLGIASADFPNMFTIVGPHNASVRCNVPRCIEQNVEWITELMKYARDHDIALIEATKEAEEDWTDHVNSLAEGRLFFQVDSYLTGVNTNVDGKNVRRVLQYLGGAPAYRAKCDEVAALGYTGFTITGNEDRSSQALSA